jgi:hypothetical protein
MPARALTCAGDGADGLGGSQRAGPVRVEERFSFRADRAGRAGGSASGALLLRERVQVCGRWLSRLGIALSSRGVFHVAFVWRAVELKRMGVDGRRAAQGGAGLEPWLLQDTRLWQRPPSLWHGETGGIITRQFLHGAVGFPGVAPEFDPRTTATARAPSCWWGFQYGQVPPPPAWYAANNTGSMQVRPFPKCCTLLLNQPCVHFLAIL